jgi:hypothetical protein
MAYALKGCGIICRSELVKRDLDAQKSGRRPVSAILPPRFEHSRRFYIGGGAYVSSTSGSFPENPVLDACLVEQQPLINQRVSVLKSVAEVRGFGKMQEQERQKGMHVLSEGVCVCVCPQCEICCLFVGFFCSGIFVLSCFQYSAYVSCVRRAYASIFKKKHVIAGRMLYAVDMFCLCLRVLW